MAKDKRFFKVTETPSHRVSEMKLLVDFSIKFCLFPLKSTY